MKKIAISFSYSKNSMQYRGLKLLNSILSFDEIVDLKSIGGGIPICSSNSPDGVVHDSVKKLDTLLKGANILFFAIPEAAGHYAAAFKNVIDWLVTLYNFNSQLAQGYSLTSKPIYIFTFTPSPSAGGRHFQMTRSLLEEKFGANVRQMHVFNNCWEHLLPGHTEFVVKVANSIKEDIVSLNLRPTNNTQSVSVCYDVNSWLKQYEKWNKAWENMENR